MAKKWEKALDIKEDLLKELREVFGGNLLSVYITGVAATPRYKLGISIIEILTILEDNRLQAMEGFYALEKRWDKKGVEFTFFMNKEFIEGSLDSFPIEFYDFKCRHLLLEGDDILQDLEISNDDLRLQIERELRGKSLNLKRELVRAGTSVKEITNILNLSFPQFLTILRAFNHLIDSSLVIGDPSDDIKKTAELTKSSLDPFLKISDGFIPTKYKELMVLCLDYSEAVEELVEKIDKLITGELK